MQVNNYRHSPHAGNSHENKLSKETGIRTYMDMHKFCVPDVPDEYCNRLEKAREFGPFITILNGRNK
jgi:hypothetical protein